MRLHSEFGGGCVCVCAKALGSVGPPFPLFSLFPFFPFPFMFRRTKQSPTHHVLFLTRTHLASCSAWISAQLSTARWSRDIQYTMPSHPAFCRRIVRARALCVHGLRDAFCGACVCCVCVCGMCVMCRFDVHVCVCCARACEV